MFGFVRQSLENQSWLFSLHMILRAYTQRIEKFHHSFQYWLIRHALDNVSPRVYFLASDGADHHMMLLIPLSYRLIIGLCNHWQRSENMNIKKSFPRLLLIKYGHGQPALHQSHRERIISLSRCQ